MNTYTAEQPEKEQEVIPTVTSIDVPNPEGDKMTSLDHADVQLDSKSRGIHVPIFFSFKSTKPHMAIEIVSSWMAKVHYSVWVYITCK